MNQRSERILFAQHGGIGWVKTSAFGIGILRFEKVANASAMTAAEFVFKTGNAGETEVDDPYGAVPIHKDVAGMHV
ncbi:MAG: hypothetical protein WAJ99_09285, partial [Candidatus Sulfotelmatobacter sp.]